MYDLIVKPFVRKMNPDKASYVALKYFQLIGRLPGGRFITRLIYGNRPQGLEKNLFGLDFYNPVGLGSGLDRCGDLYNVLEDLGFSFVEIGPLNAESTRHAIANIQETPQTDILAACINKDFLLSFSLAYDFCDMFVIELPDASTKVLDDILECRLAYDGYKPVIVKLPQAISTDSMTEVVNYCRYCGVDGIETRSYEQTVFIHGISQGRIPIMANCHIKSPAEAHKMLVAGADLIVVKSGLVSEGPSLVRRIIKYLIQKKLDLNERNSQ